MKVIKASSLLLICGLTGCGLWGPDYVKPKISYLDKWRSKDSLSISGSDIDISSLAWWRQFNDIDLNVLIDSALKNNNNIQQAIGNIIQAKGYLEQVKYSWIPTLSINPGYSTSNSFATQLNSQTSSATIGANTGYSVGLTPVYTLNILQQLRTQESANALLLSARYTKNSLRITVLSQVVGGYFTLIQQKYLLEIQQQLVNENYEIYNLANIQYKENYISLLTLQNYYQTYENSKAQIALLENNITQSENALQVLINKSPGKIITGSKFEGLNMNGKIPVNLPSSVLKFRPDIMAAEQQLISANAKIGVATSYYFPTLNLTTGIGSATSNLTNLFQATDSFWQIKAFANLPFSYAQFGQIKSAKGAYYSAYYNYANTIRVALQQVDNGLSAHQKLLDNYKELLNFYSSSKVSYDLSKQNFNQGYFNKLQELSAKVQLDNANILLANSKLQQLQSIVNLYQALAGGYNVSNTEKENIFGDARDSGK